MSARSLALPVLMIGLAALLAPRPAAAQTRFSVTGGAVVPFGDFADATDPSPRFGVRAEFQPVNAIGQRRLLSVLLDGSVAILDAKPVVVGGSPDDESSTLLSIGAGVRAYSRVAPFFVSGGVGWARWQNDLGPDRNGFDLQGGLGFLVPLGAVMVEVEAVLHEVLFDEDDIQYLTAGAGLALPF